MISEADPELCERDPRRVVRHEVDQLLDLVALAGATRARRRACGSTSPKQIARGRSAIPPTGRSCCTWAALVSRRKHAREHARDRRSELRALGPARSPASHECEDVRCRLRGGRRRDAGWCAACLSTSGRRSSSARACVVTVDTGATHVASAVRRPTVVAFEHRYFRLNSQEWAPYGVPHVLVRKPAGEDSASLAQFRGEIVRGARPMSLASLLHA